MKTKPLTLISQALTVPTQPMVVGGRSWGQGFQASVKKLKINQYSDLCRFDGRSGPSKHHLMWNTFQTTFLLSVNFHFSILKHDTSLTYHTFTLHVLLTNNAECTLSDYPPTAITAENTDFGEVFYALWDYETVYHQLMLCRNCAITFRIALVFYAHNDFSHFRSLFPAVTIVWIDLASSAWESRTIMK